jgi:hypothetical protein
LLTVGADELVVYDSSTTANKKITLDNLGGALDINSQEITGSLIPSETEITTNIDT